jgi:RNA polymerase sigma factor (sigma-70 family)
LVCTLDVSAAYDWTRAVGMSRSRPFGRSSILRLDGESVSLSILERIAAGDQAAVAECIERYGGLVWSLARRFLGSSGDAEDAVQEIFVELWKCAGRFNPATAAEATFVSMIARRRLIDRRRKMAGAETRTMGEVEYAGAADAQAPSPAAMTEDVSAATEAISQLPPDQQRVLRLSIVQGLTHDEIARATGMPLGTVKTNIRRGLARVRDRLRERTGVMP